jgi:2-(1,2-epoxy-1,2-dihydrophenyl)acetyl-CoA isomerase
VGLHRAKELALLAEVIDASEADRIGLVNRILPEADLDAHVADVVARIAAGPPLALSMSKALLNNGAQTSMSQALEAEGQAQAVNFGTQDTSEAARAWGEKRQPEFEGR